MVERGRANEKGHETRQNDTKFTQMTRKWHEILSFVSPKKDTKETAPPFGRQTVHNGQPSESYLQYELSCFWLNKVLNHYALASFKCAADIQKPTYQFESRFVNKVSPLMLETLWSLSCITAQQIVCYPNTLKSSSKRRLPPTNHYFQLMPDDLPEVVE